MRGHAYENLSFDPVYFSSIEIDHFRNLKKVELSPSSGLNLFIGQNGQGKTNLLEALYLAMNGYSFRTHQVDSLVSLHQPEKISRIQLTLHNERQIYKLEVILQGKTKKFRLNSKPISVRELAKRIPSVLFAPESLSAIKSGPEERRTLLDEIAQTHDPLHVDRLVDFLKTLRNRNALLREIVKNGFQRSHQDILEILNARFVDQSVDLVISRLNGLQAIEPLASRVMSKISNKTQQKTSMRYLISSQPFSSANSEEIRNAIGRRMSELREAELAQGTTLAGPHRHDLQILLDGMDSRQHCSQGQQRALILAIKISQVMQHFDSYGRYPVLLLDDVLSELDAEKRAFLLGFLKSVKTQTFVTSTEGSDFKQQLQEEEFKELTTQVAHTYFAVHSGLIEKMSDEVVKEFAENDVEFGNGRGTFV
ncbi:MAG: DNA replication/repair protein RecF [Bdellovibrionales bacterium]